MGRVPPRWWSGKCLDSARGFPKYSAGRLGPEFQKAAIAGHSISPGQCARQERRPSSVWLLVAISSQSNGRRIKEAYYSASENDRPLITKVCRRRLPERLRLFAVQLVQWGDSGFFREKQRICLKSISWRLPRRRRLFKRPPSVLNQNRELDGSCRRKMKSRWNYTTKLVAPEPQVEC